MKVLLQFPEGLKDKALRYAKELEGSGDEVFISCSPTFGACDLAIDEAKKLGAEKLVHFGHAEFHKVDFNVEYVEFEIDAPLGILQNTLRYLKDYGTIGIVTTIQHVHQLGDIKAFYERNGKKVVIGKPYGFAKKAGQILGCDVGSSASVDGMVDAHVYFGGGVFHPLGAVLATKKPFIAVEPFENRIERIDNLREQYRRRSRGRVLSAVDAKSFGILLSTKNGQHNPALAKLLKDKIASAGLDAEILVSNTFDFDSINNMMEFDAFVNTACPRIAVDDTERLRRPLLSSNELMEVLAMKSELAKMREGQVIR